MPNVSASIDTFLRSANNAEARTNLGASAVIATPNVLHVAGAPVGNDTTGDGTLAKPYRTGTRAYQVTVAPACIEFGAGSFTVEGSSSLFQGLTFRGRSVTTTQLLIISRQYDVDIIADDLTLSIMAAGLPGQAGANGTNDEDPNGVPGEPGGNGRNVTVQGHCWVADVDISAGNGGQGGNGSGSLVSVGAPGGPGGNKGSLTLQVNKLIGAVTASQGVGGMGGTGQLTNGTAGTDGSAAAATLTFDSCDIRLATLPQPEVILSRCLYLTSQSLSITDDGGNAVK